MNSSGWIRGIMTKKYSEEDFLLHVGECVERQLKEWDNEYEVIIMKLADYSFVVKKGAAYYELKLSVEDIELLKNRSPFALDREIWIELKEHGVQIFEGYGNYMAYVL